MKPIFHNKGILAISVLLFSTLAFFVSTIIPLKYQSESEILILQKNMDLDPYRATKASEFAAEILKRVMLSSEFMNGVLARTGESAAKFGDTPEDQLENWGDSVEVSTLSSTGIIKITVLDNSKSNDRKLTEAVLSEIQQNGMRYHGNENISLKKIGGPVYYDDPAFPVIWLNTLIAAIFGLFFSIGMILLNEKKIRYWFYDDLTRSPENDLFKLRLESLRNEISLPEQTS